MKKKIAGRQVPASGTRRRLIATAALTVAAAFSATALGGAGLLGPGDDQLASGEYFDRIVFSGNTGDEVLIELASTDFDAYVIVVDAGENTIAFQDDGEGVGLNVRLPVTLPGTGPFTVVVTSAAPGESGRYSLTLSGGGSAALVSQLPLPTQVPQAAGPRTVSGTVTDTAGRPIAGARIMIVPAVTTGDAEVRSDSNGNYLVTDLPEVPYRARAWIYLDHGGDQVCLRLGMDSPADYDTFSPGMGAVKNFRWQLTGPIEDQRTSQGTFGGTLSLFNTWLFEDAGNSIEFSFTPAGPLIDGSAGEAFTRVLDVDRDTYLRDIPVGPYQLQATMVEADGTRLPMLLSHSEYGEEPRGTLDINWIGYSDCNLGSGWDWTNLYVWLP